jgi:hypothetical protein
MRKIPTPLKGLLVLLGLTGIVGARESVVRHYTRTTTTRTATTSHSRSLQEPTGTADHTPGIAGIIDATCITDIIEPLIDTVNS